MQNHFIARLFSWGSNQEKLSTNKPTNTTTRKLRRSSLLFLLGLTLFCGLNIIIFNRQQPVAAAIPAVKHQFEFAANLTESDRAEPLDYDLPSSRQAIITAQVSASDLTSTPSSKIPKHLDNFKSVVEHKNLATREAIENTSVKERLLKRETDDVERSENNSSLEPKIATDLPPLSSPEQYIPSAFEGYIWPAQGTFTSGYGWRWGRLHQGIDIAAPVGTPVMAAAAGTVIAADWNSGGYGNLIEIEHADGSVTLYAHNNTLLVSLGQQVAQNQQIAEMGSTGNSTGSHLHFEIHSSDRSVVDPMIYLSQN